MKSSFLVILCLFIVFQNLILISCDEKVMKKNIFYLPGQTYGSIDPKKLLNKCAKWKICRKSEPKNHQPIKNNPKTGLNDLRNILEYEAGILQVIGKAIIIFYFFYPKYLRLF